MKVTLRRITDSEELCSFMDEDSCDGAWLDFTKHAAYMLPDTLTLVRKMYPLVLKLSYQKCYLFYDQWPEKSCHDWPADLPLPVEKQHALCEPCQARVLVKELEETS